VPAAASLSCRPRLLALDTSTERLCVGLQTPDGAWLREEAGGPQASARLVPLVLELLAEANLALGTLDAIAFAQGPGAFTGLRTACAAAQGLAFGAGKPVLALDSLAIVAEAARVAVVADEREFELWVAMDARMDEVYAGHYRWVPDGWQTLRAAALYDLPTLDALWAAQPPQCVAGSAPPAFGERLPLGGATVVPEPLPRSAALLALAEQAWHEGRVVPAEQALPLYLRDKVALTTAEREALKAGSR
jgi:tRNA threonylcarbamoyladenosine biosynthesis protein TsaB